MHLGHMHTIALPYAYVCAHAPKDKNQHILITKYIADPIICDRPDARSSETVPWKIPALIMKWGYTTPKRVLSQ
jgi:hypothetical protein